MKKLTYIEPDIKTNVFDIMETNEHEKIIFGYNQETGLKMVVAIHDTTLGPSTGGTRMVDVSEAKAIEEALRLSYAMTYKNAIINEPFGGSKAVVIGDPSKPKSKEFLHAIGNFIESLGGAFLTGVDMGLSLDDAKIIREKTKYIFNSKGCSGVTTGHGVYKGIKECAKEFLNNENLDGLTIAVQGLGYVGGTLVELLSSHNVKIYGSDLDEALTKKYEKEYSVEIVDPKEIHKVKCDIFSPNAIGEIINDDSIDELNCKIIAGGANNQLKDEVKHSRILYAKGILHAPDFVINAGGVCHGMCEVRGEDVNNALKKTDLIPGLLKQVFALSKEKNVPPMMIAYQIAKEKVEKAKQNKSNETVKNN
ncbi:MAG: leucine dehydrogenase [Candidatus Berkelbacteria bacterium]|nr:leucine dehydrogenase [Candidatus Berkelbacteria bacterium]